MALPGLTLQLAKELFKDASDFYTSRTMVLPLGHEIRRFAIAVFHKDTISTMNHVCAEIFHEIAQDSMRGQKAETWDVTEARVRQILEEANKGNYGMVKHLAERAIKEMEAKK